MRVIIASLFIALCAASNTKRGVVKLYGSLDTLRVESGPCPEYAHVIDDYREAMHNFTIETYKHAAPLGLYHFILSPHSMWMTLAAIAEGADPANQHQLFQLLHLSRDPCIREKYYQLAATRFSSTNDVSLVSTRVLVIDQGVTLNPKWHNFVTQNSLLEVVSAPIKGNPASAENWIKQVVSARSLELKLHGNSVLLDTMDYNGLWTTTFADAVVKRAPFYSQSGQHIGAVDLMRVKRRCKIGYAASLKAQLLELPIGTDGRYSMIFALVVRDTDLRPIVGNLKSSVIPEALGSLVHSDVPIDVAIPQFTMNTELDAKSLLEDLGITNLWTDPEATRYISDPPLLPSSYVQRSKVTLNKDGVNLPPLTQLGSYGPPSNPDTSSAEFIADRPFMLGLYDTETNTCLMSIMFTRPTYPK